MITKDPSRYKNSISVAILLVLVFVLGLVTGRNVDKGDLSVLDFRNPANEVDMSKFWDVWKLVSADYVDTEKVNKDSMVYGAIKGMVNSFDDPATVFLDPEETKEFDSASEGKYFEGIGAELGYEGGQVIVVTPLEGSPAKEAGIRPGDYILKIDSYELKSTDSVYDAVSKIRGKAGTEVTLNILHKGDSVPVDIKIVRREITVPSMTLEFIGDNKDVAWFKVSRFTDTTFSSWISLWNTKVKEISASKTNKVILDLRGNPGGFFDAAIYAGDDLLEEGYVISQQRDGNGRTQKYESTKGGNLTDAKLIVLVNSGSASASEILAGALQQSKRAVIIGENTYGKGTAQKIYNLSDGSSLHLTILRWLLPDGSNIDRESSIHPDIEVILTNDDFKEGRDPQLDRALKELSK